MQVSICLPLYTIIYLLIRKVVEVVIYMHFHIDISDEYIDILIYVYLQQEAMLHSLFYLEIALRVSGGTTIHHQERKQLYVQHLVFVTPLVVRVCYSTLKPVPNLPR